MSAIIISRGFHRREELFNQAQATRELLATTLSRIADAVISTNARAQITFLNPAAEQLTGWKSEECADVHISDMFCIVSEATREKIVNPLERALAQGTAVGLANHTKLVARHGAEISLDDSAAPIRIRPIA